MSRDRYNYRPRHNETPRMRDFVSAGMPARTFSEVNVAVRSVQHPRSPDDTFNMGFENSSVKGIKQVKLSPKLR